MITELNERSREIFRHIVDAWLESGAPVGSRTLSLSGTIGLSSASIRNVMADLETLGLLYAPHHSAGRLPTQRGLRLYVDGLMETGDLSTEERRQIDAECQARGIPPEKMLARASALLSGLSSCAGIVVAPKADKPVRQIQFARLDALRTLAIIVFTDGLVENRVMEIPADLPDSALEAAGNFLSAKSAGLSLDRAAGEIRREITEKRARLDALTEDLVRRGLALPAGENESAGHIVIRGQSRLLDDVRAIEDLEKARALLGTLEESDTAARILDAAREAEGVRIYIGTENRIFEHSGWSMVVAPWRSDSRAIVGAIGVIGPSRINYGRIIPIVDYTARALSRIADSES